MHPNVVVVVGVARRTHQRAVDRHHAVVEHLDQSNLADARALVVGGFDVYGKVAHGSKVRPRRGLAREASELAQVLQHVLSEHVKFEVDGVADLQFGKVGVLPGVGNQGHAEVRRAGIHHGQRHAVERDRSLGDGAVQLVCWVLDGDAPAAVGFGNFGNAAHRVDVALHGVAVEAASDQGGTFEVDGAADGPGSEAGFVERLSDGGHAESVRNPLTMKSHHRQAAAVVGHALVDFKFGRQGRRHVEVHVASVGGDGRDLAVVFDDSGEHAAKVRVLPS